jgi:ComF family protein
VALDLAFPLRCVGCGALGSVACPPCRIGIQSAPPNPANAPWCYDGFARDLIGALKFRNARAVADLAAEAMAEVLCTVLNDADTAVVVTWAPTSARRRRERGYDQAELLARQLARRLALRLEAPATVTALLERVDGRTQTGRDRAERLVGPRFITARDIGTATSTVVVVDDVVTTGATLASAARCLLEAGARRVVWSAAAATPD